MTALADLIAKLEAAKEGSADLTADIYEAVGCEVIRSPRAPNGIAWKYRGRGPSGRVAERWESMEDLTTSLVAALTLVPEGWLFVLNQVFCGNGSFTTAELFDGEHEIATGESVKPPLALCIAALKARAAS